MNLSLLILLACILLSEHSRAISWFEGKQKESTATPGQSYEETQEDEIATIIRGAESLQTYSRKPDCFRRAAGLIQTRCSELDMDEDERIMAAISMTLCELSTANHHSPPLECVAFSTESRSSRPPAHGPAHRSCVEALSRSAQYWSSYSGYLREVSQLCYAFRRWNDIDTARDIYRNATLEKVTLLQYLNDRELKLRQAEEISQLLLRDILDGVSNFRSSATDTQSAIQDLVRKVSAGFDQGALALADAISLLLAHAEHNQMEAILRVDSALGEAIQRHSTSLDLVSTSTQRSFHDHVEGIFAISRRYFADIGDVAGEIYMRLSVVGGELGDMHQSVSQLATSLSALGSQVDSNLAQAQDTHALQVESSEAALDLANSLAELSAAAHHEMQNISGTAEGIRESMLDAAAEALGPDWLAWGRAFALWVCGVILRVDPSSLEHVAALPMVRALIAATRVASWCVRAAASSSVCAIARAVREALARQLANASLEPRPRERLCDYSEAWDPQ